MSIKTLLKQKNMTVYNLSKVSGIPKTTLYDIYSGKSMIGGCNANTVYQLALALGCSMEDLMKTDMEKYDDAMGKNKDKSYLEIELPQYLNTSIKNMEKSWGNIESGKKDLEWDIYWCELNADINMAEVEQEITKEQASYLRNKYLRMEG